MVSAWMTRGGWLRPGCGALVDVVAVQTHDERLVGLVAQDLQRLDDAVGDRVARGDTAEHVDEHALDLAVTEDDVQTGGHHLGRGATADVQEVGRLHIAVLLTGVGDDVQGRHDQARTVADDADLTVELDVVEVVLLGLELQGIGGVAVLELGMARLAEVGVGVQGDLAVQRQDLVVGRAHQRVDLDEGGVLLGEHLPQLLDGHGCGVEHLGGQVALLGDLAREGQVDTLDGIHRHLGQALGLGGGDLFDLHTALDRAHGQVGAVGTVEQEGDVVLLGDIAGLGDQQLLHDVALDVQGRCSWNGCRRRPGWRRTSRHRPYRGPHLDLCLDHHRLADLLGDGFGVLRGVGDPAGWWWERCAWRIVSFA